jgi:hypothetical protein
VDSDGLTFACATTAEQRVAKRAGLNAARVGVRVANGVPAGRLVSFGLAGALRDGLGVGAVLDATRVVDEHGVTLWEGGPLGVAGARAATMLASDVVVHDAGERRRLHESSGADAVDMESGVLARTGRLAGVVRVISDDVTSAIEGIDTTVRPDGSTDALGLLRWLGARRADALRSVFGAVAALKALEKAMA